MYSREAIGFAGLNEDEIASFKPTPTRGTNPSGDRAQIAVSVVTCERNRRLDDTEGAHVPA
jgi:hypothetical protein